MEENTTTTTTVDPIPGVERNTEKYQYYLTLLRNIVNTTYENLDNFHQYIDDKTLSDIDMEKTVMEVKLADSCVNTPTTWLDDVYACAVAGD